ncbi:metallophosphoesterase, PPA1498 family [Actinacidiphila yanglinensis]|uniref:Metallophosphoesterase, PPA1498 family n=1 Tax=Actinacidiphila yanglinensis TaxID=310779 RepID=A0A1H6DPK5_9ACTN|nr:TIGR03767 family metallophosphoesterase [Actinacidiphila yanglinensis]SEG86576.1 metallophosphoesterase, PPA1498 family [Actinacidiphila yanglinensis]
MPAPEPARIPSPLDRRTLLIASGAGLAAAGGATAWVFGPGSDRASARPTTAPSVPAPRTATSAPATTTPPAPAVPTTVGTTLHSVATPTGKGPFRRLTDGPGWKRVVRADLAPAHPGRADRRTVVAAFVQLTDLHVMDVQSPLRMEWMREHGPHDWRPHEALSVLSTLSLIDRVNSLRGGPVTGHPLSFAITTGDNTDNNSTVELDWFLTAMSGGRIDPNTGDPQAFEGIQNSGLPLFWQPESARTDADKKLGFPHLPGYLSAAMRPLTAPGLTIPWYSTVGNHDALFSGAYRSGPHGSFAAQTAVGDRKLEQVPHADMMRVYKAVSAQQDPDGTLVRGVLQRYARTARTVTPDARRAPFTPQEYLAAHLDPRRTGAGPVGHGYAAEGVDADHMYYSFPVAEGVLGISLDTTDRGGAFLGSIGSEQLAWLGRTLDAHSDQHILVFSHHPSHSMTNLRADPARPKEKRHSGDELTALLKKHPNVLAWINGHSHHNRIDPRGTFWEVNTASHVDYPQLARVIEIVDNHDGTLSLITTLIESAAPHRTDYHDLSTTGLASLYRELAFNAPGADISSTTGKADDRNAELLLRKR